MIFNVRLAKLEDIEFIADIHTQSWLFAYSECIPMDIIAKHNARWSMIWTKLLSNNTNSHYVVMCDNNIIGFLTINPTRDDDLPETVFELVGLYLAPDFIGKGFGKQAINWVKNEIKSRGSNSISLWVLDKNFRAKTFYKKCGFIADGKTKPSGLSNTKEERYIYNSLTGD